MFVRMIIVVAQKTSFDLRKVLSYPITTYPLSLSHCDGSHVKTEKSVLLKKLESLQTTTITELPQGYAQVMMAVFFSIPSCLKQTWEHHMHQSPVPLLSIVCSGKASEVHVCLDKYVANSIKESERKLRSAEDTPFVISGDQIMRQRGQKLLTNGILKNEFSKFLLKEWGKDHYWNLFNGKTLFASFGIVSSMYLTRTIVLVYATQHTCKEIMKKLMHLSLSTLQILLKAMLW